MCARSRHKPDPAPPPTAPTQLKKSEVTGSDVATGRRGLAIKFPHPDLAEPGGSTHLSDSTSEVDGLQTDRSSSLPYREKKLTPFAQFETVKEPVGKVWRSPSERSAATAVEKTRGVASLLARHSPPEMGGKADALAHSDGLELHRQLADEEESFPPGRTKAATSKSHTSQTSKSHSTIVTSQRSKSHSTIVTTQRSKSHSSTASSSRSIPTTSCGSRYNTSSSGGGRVSNGSARQESTPSVAGRVRPKANHRAASSNS